MNKLKIFFIIIAALLFLFSSRPQVLAADLEVTFENDPLFSQAADGHWFPGRSETRWVAVKNNASEDKTVIVETLNEISTFPEDLADVLRLTISIGGTDVYGGSLGIKYLSDFYKETELSLSTLSSGQSVTYNFTVSLDELVGNPWQGKDTGFDLKIGFYGEAPTPTPTPTPTLVLGLGPLGAAAPGAAGPPVCTATTPTSAPVLSVTGVGVNSVSLSWTSVSPVTHYLIAYGLSAGNYIYGNPNIGNVTSFTVSSLSGGTTYYFAVKGVNDCAPGPYSNEVSATPSGPVIVGPPPGFAPILGVTAPSPELEEEKVEEKILGEIAGVEEMKVCPWWWILLLLQVIIQVVYYYLISKREIKRWWIFPLLISIIAFFAHKRLHQGYLPSRFCPYFWIGDVLILASTTFFYLRSSRYPVKSEKKD